MVAECVSSERGKVFGRCVLHAIIPSSVGAVLAAAAAV